nr:helix-turn-helix domain-containing protein [Ramlibacter monticola]
MEQIVGCIGKSEVAKKIGVKIRKLEYMIREGEFPPGVQIGKSLQWLEEVVDAWLERAFAPQREWMRNGSVVSEGGTAECAPGLAPVTPQAPTAAVEAVNSGARVITTALSAAGVPAPVRLV